MNSSTHRRKDQWQVLISQWEASGQSAIAFCKKQKIGYASFCNWRKRLSTVDADASSSVESAHFIDLGALSSSTKGWHIVLSLGNGVELRLSQH